MKKTESKHTITSPGVVSDQGATPTDAAMPPTHNGDVSGPGPQGRPHGDAGQIQPPGSARPVNIFDEVEARGGASKPVLGLVQLGDNETALIPFTANGVKVDLHYCPEPDIKGYVLCNGRDCVLCRIGRKKDSRNLIPVYSPTGGDVAVLAVSPSLRPHSLLPQLANVLKAGPPMVMFVSRQHDHYKVSTRALEEDVDGGEEVIEAFKEEFEAGRIDLASGYARIANEQLAMLPEIARMLALKGGQVQCSK
jgi:hypothetical protein